MKELYSKQHMDIVSSPGYHSASGPMTKQNSHESGLSDEFLEEVFGNKKICAGHYEACRASEVTQDDVENLVQGKSKENEEIPFYDFDFDTAFAEFLPKPEEIIPKPVEKSVQRVLKPVHQPVIESRSKLQSSPPRKILAQTPPVNNLNLLDNINSNFIRPSGSLSKAIVSSQFKSPIVREPMYKTSEPKPAENDLKINPSMYPHFKSAHAELRHQNLEKHGTASYIQPKKTDENQYPANKPFKSPMQKSKENEINPLLAGIDEDLLNMIKSEVIDTKSNVSWDDIAGLTDAKEKLEEAVVCPLLRPDLFRGIRSAPKGILLFGPPGTGKTLIGKCIASQSAATFFSISASSLTSKWIGQGEKLVRALFLYARVMQPSVIFMDEIDSILMKRSENEHESSRRLKTEFLVQLDGAFKTDDDDKILVIGATNRPQELDDAARRRFTQRLYIPLPCIDGRKQLVANIIKKEPHNISESDIEEIGEKTEGYSGADLKTLVKEAAMEPTRGISTRELMTISEDEVSWSL